MKPVILSTIGDIALALGPGFKVYVTDILGILQQASSVESDRVGSSSVESEGGWRGRVESDRVGGGGKVKDPMFMWSYGRTILMFFNFICCLL